jgi:hypothetical protein
MNECTCPRDYYGRNHGDYFGGCARCGFNVPAAQDAAEAAGL